MTSQNSVNFQDLKNIYASDTKVKALFDVYAQRVRGRQDSSVPRTRRVLKAKGIDMTAQEMSEFYRKMQKAGVGRCVSGRRGRVNRFVWGFHLKSVAEAAQGKATTLEAAPKARVHLPQLEVPKKAYKPRTSSTSADAIAEPTPLDRKIVVRKAGLEIEFPLDMSADDWKDAAYFLNNLSTVK